MRRHAEPVRQQLALLRGLEQPRGEAGQVHSYLHYVFSLVWVLVPEINEESASGPAA
ncbi:hypothetical protein AB0D38_06340 [Streptomyces sp. NPDC048279]|uniref:hypothetical protein n=1 Tax=Streptomyces sp. NPDC048279 TaxID=3154714 RepID=UPI00342579E1